MKSFLPGLLHCLKLLIICTGLMALILIVGAAGFLYFVLTPSHDQVARVESPDHAVVAILIETNGGATTSFGNQVRLSERRSTFGGTTRVAYLYGATRSATAYGVNLRWLSATELNIEYLNARSANLEKSETRIGSTMIHVALKADVPDLTAPSGGMLYNKTKSAEKLSLRERSP